jgi:hypothetical protein
VRWFETDVLGLLIGLMFKSQNTQGPMMMGLIGSPETSVSNHLTPRKIPEDGRVQVYLSFTTFRVSSVLSVYAFIRGYSHLTVHAIINIIIHITSNLSDDRSTASSKTIPPLNAI